MLLKREKTVAFFPQNYNLKAKIINLLSLKQISGF